MRFFLFFWLFAGGLYAQSPITLEDIWEKGAFNPKGIPGFNFLSDGIHYTLLENNTIQRFDLRTGALVDTVFHAPSHGFGVPGWKGKIDGYQFSPDESRILLSAGSIKIYRHSALAEYFVFDRKTRQLTRLFDGALQRDATFSPDGTKVGFSVKNDLYVKDLNTDRVTRITHDGQINAIINGASDWVYEEEFVLIRAFEWSPDGRHVAYLRFDERAVPEFSMETYKDGAYPGQTTFKYPKVGERNSDVGAYCYDLSAGVSRKLDIPGRAIKTGAEKAPHTYADDYLPRIGWTPDGSVCVTWMDRLQQTQRLWLFNPSEAPARLLAEFKNNQYLDLQTPVFLPDGSGFLIQSEKSGFNHIYKYDMTGREERALTKGDWEVTQFYGMDAKSGTVYFQAAAKSPMQRELYSVKLNGKKLKKLSDRPGTHGAIWNKTYDYYINTWSAINTPPQYRVCGKDGKTVREIQLNRELQDKQTQYGVLPVEFFKFETSEKVELNGWMIRPKGKTFEGQKLPLLMFVYGGPGSQQVTDAWKGANYWWFQMLAQEGYVIACVDNRGTGGRGEAFKKITYKQLGRYETEDQIEAAKYLGRMSFIDPARIGIFGWSYGGYMTSLCITKGADVFNSAIAVAPVTHWKWYDSVYTERYMQTTAENKEGYERNSPVNMTQKLKGNYLLVHGLADDNVHFQHTAEMADELIANNKQFDTMIYPDKNHGINGDGTRLHLFRLMTKFLNRKLKGETSSSAKP